MFCENAGNLNLSFGIPISLADALQNVPAATANIYPFTDSDFLLPMSTAVLSGPQSSLTATTNNHLSYSRKRGRECSYSYPTACRIPTTPNLVTGEVLSFLGEDVAPQIRQQQQELDRFIAVQIENVKLELEEKRKKHSRRLMAVLGEAIAKKLQQKEAEIESMGKINCALEEKVRTLCVENQIWQNLARSTEATANALKGNLEQALARVSEGRGDSEEDAGAAESCCCDGAEGGKRRRGAGREEEGESRRETGCWSACRRCGEGASTVLLLPCRHLCLCGACSPAVDACPICKCTKSATVQVYLS
ncbi:putative BOI-related E3 ubiquitin-protein ligase 3 [Nymphaea thermarum]|nr:putative BOI-related E3 ubiquitin-protein ligase 3 [Nymphaea thermarum]